MYKSIFHHQYIRQYLYPGVCGMVGALIVSAFISHAHKTPIATINITGMVSGFLKETVQQNLSTEQKQQKLNQFSQILQKTMDEMASSKQIVILPSEAVLSGTTDLTQEVMHRIKKGMQA